MPVARAVELACQILAAIGAAHRRGFMHRDLKPANVLDRESIKLLDFGLASTPNGHIYRHMDGILSPRTRTRSR